MRQRQDVCRQGYAGWRGVVVVDGRHVTMQPTGRQQQCGPPLGAAGRLGLLLLARRLVAAYGRTTVQGSTIARYRAQPTGPDCD
eukprot:COSAG01_NODE_817_length_13376_cov_2.970101_1_plen_84_part_00